MIASRGGVRLAVTWLLTGIPVIACTSDHEPFGGRVSKSRFFEYHDRETAPLRPTLLTRLDEHAEKMGQHIGLSLAPGAAPFRYYKFPTAESFASSQDDCTPPEAGACALGDAVYSTEPFHAHELAHDYAFRAWGGWSIGLFNEGVAVALSCDPLLTEYELGSPTAKPITLPGASSWRDALYVRYGNTPYGYELAGVFVTYLAARFGWGKIAEVYRRVGPGAAARDVAKEFARVYPVSMDEAWRAAMDRPGAPSCIRDWVCHAVPARVGEVLSPGCDGEVHRSIAVGAAEGVALSIRGKGVSLASCSGRGQYMFDAFESGHTIHWANLPPDTYAIVRNPFPFDEVGIQSSLHAPLVQSTCGLMGAATLDERATTVIDLLEGPARSGWIPLGAGAGRVYNVTPVGLGFSGSLDLCESCDPSASCVAIPQGKVTTVTIGDRATLRLRGIVAASSWVQILLAPGAAGSPGH